MGASDRFGVIDVGGGMRGIYAAGVLDRCMDDGVHFDVAIGISAGSANITSYISGQRGRNFAFYHDYSFRKEYMSPRNFMRSGSYIDMDYVYGTLSNSDGENPVDYDSFESSDVDWRIIASDAETGESVSFGKDHMSRDGYDILKASSSIPFVCQPYEIDGRGYFDGALGNTVPIDEAFDMGCTKVVLILTKPEDVLRSPSSDAPLAKLIERKYPKAAERLRGRADRYNEGVALAKALEEDGYMMIVAPDDTCGVSTLSLDKESLEQLYAKGYADGAKVAPFLYD